MPLTREELADELYDAMDNVADCDTTIRDFAEAAVRKLIELGIVDFGLDADAMAATNEALAPND